MQNMFCLKFVYTWIYLDKMDLSNFKLDMAIETSAVSIITSLRFML